MPTTQRVFGSDDQVTVFLRVYQGGNKPLLPVTVHAIVKDARAADYSLTLPAATLAPGPYLLTIEAAVDEKTSVKRDVRFSIR